MADATTFTRSLLTPGSIGADNLREMPNGPVGRNEAMTWAFDLARVNAGQAVALADANGGGWIIRDWTGCTIGITIPS